MKKITLMLTPLILIFTLNAQSISSGSTLRQYSKPGASIDMEYTSTKVDANTESDINITLSTPLIQGDIIVEMTLDEELESISTLNKTLNYQIQPSQQTFFINFKVQSAKEGLYYIRLLTKVDNGYGTKLRSFAVPVYVGEKSEIINKSLNNRMKALSSGENISISKAVETIEVLK